MELIRRRSRSSQRSSRCWPAKEFPKKSYPSALIIVPHPF
jgi:hypothetical protein